LTETEALVTLAALNASGNSSSPPREGSLCAVITGASSGIGEAIALLLGEQGFRLVLTARRRELLDGVAARIGRPDDVRVVAGDLREESLAPRLVETALEAWGGLDVLVNNAGTARQVPIAEVTPELLQGEMATNCFGHAALIVRAWPVFVRQRRGVIVNVSSMAAVDPLPGFLSYGATKAALESLARSAAAEGRAHGIRAYNVMPGTVATPLSRALFGSATPQRALEPRDVASVVLACIEGQRAEASEGSIRVVAGQDA
jgi:NAD(P)-dependent dehydrogenase (short-subunit alcohol dehydrogenase family)